eukprot:Pompholyxophrys_punicea_v1_NODE_19_length_5902_cov_21.503677.p1 type:complete len:734 gc:universal NODE_19_length_5902_cov_21.503677:2263-62(-)
MFVYVSTDASNFALGAVLFQNKLSEEHDATFNYIPADQCSYIAFASRSLSNPERNYSATKRELLAIIFALLKFKQHLWGKEFVLFTDHKALTFIFTQRHTNAMLENWLDILLEFSFTIIHCPGVLHILSDSLSRLYPDSSISHSAFTVSAPFTSLPADILVITRHGRQIRVPARFLEESDSNSLKKSFKKQISASSVAIADKNTPHTPTEKSSELMPAPEQIASSEQRTQENRPSNLTHALKTAMNNQIQDSLTLPGSLDSTVNDTNKPDNTAQFVDEGSTLSAQEKKSLLERLHLFGHFGVEALIKAALSEGHSWKELRQDCSQLVKACVQCQRYSSGRPHYHPLTFITANLPLDHLALDLLGPMPTSAEGFNYILVIVDICSRFVFLRSLVDKSASAVAHALFLIITDFGPPKILQSDNGTEFINEVIRQLTSLFCIDHRCVSPYHPRANGAAERFVQSTMRTLLKTLQDEIQAWHRVIPSIQLMLNSKVAALHGASPFSNMFTRELNGFRDYENAPDVKPLDAEAVKSRQRQAAEIVFPAVKLRSQQVQERRKTAFDSSHCITDQLPEGTPVMVKNVSKSNKFEPNWEGPYSILRCNKGGAYELIDSTGALFPRPVPPSLCKVIGGDFATDSMEVDAILNHRGPLNNREYLVRWKGLTSTEDSWEPMEAFEDPTIITNYWNRRKPANPENNKNLGKPGSHVKLSALPQQADANIERSLPQPISNGVSSPQ